MVADLHEKGLLIDLVDVSLSFERSVNNNINSVLSGVNLRIFNDDFIVLQGENGSGKSTLLKILAGNIIPSEGRAFVGDRKKGINIFKIPYYLSVYSVYQNLEMGIVPNFTVAEYMIFRASNSLHGCDAYYAIKAKAEKFLKKYDFLSPLLERFEEPIDVLSGGWKQMLQVATGVFVKPDLFILDEPFSHISAKYYSPIRDLIGSNTAKATILVSHIKEISNNKAITRQIHIAEGKIK